MTGKSNGAAAPGRSDRGAAEERSQRSTARPTVDAIARAAEEAGAIVMRTPAGTIIVIPTNAPSPDELLSLDRAAAVAATSTRVLREAVRTGALAAVGRQRDRAVRRRDLDAWIESRRAPISRVDVDQAERVERRLAKQRRRVS